MYKIKKVFFPLKTCVLELCLGADCFVQIRYIINGTDLNCDLWQVKISKNSYKCKGYIYYYQ